MHATGVEYQRRGRAVNARGQTLQPWTSGVVAGPVRCYPARVPTDPRARLAALGAAAALLVLLDVTLAYVDVFALLSPDTRATSLFAGVREQVTDTVRASYGLPPGGPPVVLLGNSQLEWAARRYDAFASTLVAHGAPADARVVSLCVNATAPTDFEVLARGLRPLRPWLVVVGLGPPDLGVPLVQARMLPVVRWLDTGWRDGPVTPDGLEGRLDRWLRTASRLWRWRVLLHDAVAPAREPRVPRSYLDAPRTPEEIYAMLAGPAAAAEIAAARAAFEASGDVNDFRRYVARLHGPDYLAGLRQRWRTLDTQPLQLAALRLLAEHVRTAGATPAFVLLPENPFLRLDPEVGTLVQQRSDAAADAVRALADATGVAALDLRRSVGPEAFLDFNHLFIDRSGFGPILAEAMARRGLLAGPASRPGA